MADNTPRSALNWFEIPARDLDRAQKFYEALFAAPLRREAMGDVAFVMFQNDQGGTAGCVMATGGEPAPSVDGTVVYLNAAPSIDAVLARLDAAGGELIVPKTALPDGMGYFAQFRDGEGNRVGLHAMA